MGLTYEDIRKRWPWYSGGCDYSLSSLANMTPDNVAYLNLEPPYQRGRVWTLEQGARYVAHCMETHERTTVIAIRYDGNPEDYQTWDGPKGYAGYPCDEILDGKQRITALLSWWRNEIPALLSSGESMYRSDFSPQDQSRWGGLSLLVHVKYLTFISKAETLRRYLAHNTAGTIHAPSEIQRVRAMLADIEGEK